MTDELFSFGGFELSTSRRELRRDGRVIDIGARAFDVLVALLKRPGRVVSKRELLCEVWPGITVEPNNLEVYISALRKIFEPAAFAAGPIVTVRGRGYCFAEPVQVQASPRDREPRRERADPPRAARPVGFATSLDRSLTPLIGRGEDLVLVSDLLAAGRFVTLVGPGGVGKTRLAMEIAACVEPGRSGGVSVVDFAGMKAPPDAWALLANHFHLSNDDLIDAAALASVIGEEPLFLIFDTCDRLSDMLGPLARHLIGHCASLTILSTSRRRLGVSGEVVFEVTPFAVPAPAERITAEEATRIAAVAFLADRAAALVRQFRLTDANAADMVAICHRLDGLPLGIELAVPLLRVMTPAALVGCIERRPHVLHNPDRAAPARHRSLANLVAWSFDALSVGEQTLLCRLSMFSGPIDIQALQEVGEDDDTDPDESLMIALELVEKSLLRASFEQSDTRFSLLNAVRTHARARLPTSDLRACSCRFAASVVRRLAELGCRWEPSAAEPQDVDVACLRRDLETALVWAFGTDGDRQAAIDLVSLAQPIWGQTEGFRGWSAKALSVPGPGTDPAARAARLFAWPAEDGVDASLPALGGAAACAGTPTSISLDGTAPACGG